MSTIKVVFLFYNTFRGPQECQEDLSSCSLRSVSSAVGPVVINIDGSPFSGSDVDFEFRCDPRILCASPQNTIPS